MHPPRLCTAYGVCQGLQAKNKRRARHQPQHLGNRVGPDGAGLPRRTRHAACSQKMNGVENLKQAWSVDWTFTPISKPNWRSMSRASYPYFEGDAPHPFQNPNSSKWLQRVQKEQLCTQRSRLINPEAPQSATQLLACSISSLPLMTWQKLQWKDPPSPMARILRAPLLPPSPR